jgi:hypothetical protein
MNDGRTVRADAAGTIDTARADHGLRVIGTVCHSENKGPDGYRGDYQHSHGFPSLDGTAQSVDHIVAKTRPTYDRPHDVNANVMTFVRLCLSGSNDHVQIGQQRDRG